MTILKLCLLAGIDNPSRDSASRDDRSRLQHFAKLAFIQDANPELFRLIEFAPRVVAREHVTRLFAHAPADFPAPRANQLRNLVAGLGQGAGDDPGCVPEPRGGAFRFCFSVEPEAGLAQFFDQIKIVGFAKKLVNAAANYFANVRDLLQLLDRARRDPVEIWEMLRQRSR